MPRGRVASTQTDRPRELVHAIVLSNWAVLALLCFLRAAPEVLTFFTKCPDPQILARRDEPIGERGILFRLSAGLPALICSVGVAGILEGTAFEAESTQGRCGPSWSALTGPVDPTSSATVGTSGGTCRCCLAWEPGPVPSKDMRPSAWPTQ